MKDPTLKHVPEPTANTQARAALSAPDDRKEILDVLAFYANAANWEQVETGIGMHPGEAESDRGSRARAILIKHQAP